MRRKKTTKNSVNALPTKKEQLCWTCARACDGNLCPWANGIPRDDWTATFKKKNTFKDEHGVQQTIDTYDIHECPAYVNDSKSREKTPLILISGMCASGKDYLVKRITEKYRLYVLKSCTTRPMREANEQTHTFVTNDDYVKAVRLGNVVAQTTVNGHIYYSTKSQINAADIYIVDPAGIAACAKIKDRTLYNILITADPTTRLQRLRRRLQTELAQTKATEYTLSHKYRERWEEDEKAYAQNKLDTINWTAIIPNDIDDSTAFKRLERTIQRIYNKHNKSLIKL